MGCRSEWLCGVRVSAARDLVRPLGLAQGTFGMPQVSAQYVPFKPASGDRGDFLRYRIPKTHERRANLALQCDAV